MAKTFQLSLPLGYHPMIGRANPMPPELSELMGRPEALRFSLRHIGPEFYEVSIEYLNIDGARERFDLKESIAGMIGSTHRLTYGTRLTLSSEFLWGLNITLEKGEAPPSEV